MSDLMSPDQAFDRDVPEHLRQSTLESISESSHMGCGRHGNVSILDYDRLDSINVRAEGIIEIEGKEYSFIVRDGNWDGTVLEGWEFAGAQQLIHHTPTQWALAPNPDLVGKAVITGAGPFLIFKWDAMLLRPEISEIPNKYSYDRRQQPGGKIESHYRDQAAKHGFVITTDEHAAEIRERLAQATGATK